MQTIIFTCGTNINEAIAALCAHSGATRGDFNGITLRARYATTRPTDVLIEFRRQQQLISARQKKTS
jgi:hypothetical protein